MKAIKKEDDNLLTLGDISDKTGISKRLLLSTIRKLKIPRQRTPGMKGYTFTNNQFKVICSDDYIFEKMHNYRLRDYDRSPVIITYHIYESKMNRDE
jgi:hypothetical protein